MLSAYFVRRGIFSFVVVAVLAGCASPPPVISNLRVERNPNERVPLAGICTFSSDRPVRATLTISDGMNTFTVTPKDGYATAHELMVLGLRPDRTHTVRVTVRDTKGLETVSEAVEITTDPLPEDFPPIELRVSRPAKMEPGVTMMNFFYWPGFDIERDYGLFVAVDAQGEVVWYYKTNHPGDELRRLPNGNLFYQHGREGYMVEINMLGDIVRQWHATGVPKEVPEGSIAVEVDTFHHDVDVLPNGNFLALSTEIREFEDYPTRDDRPDRPRATARVIGDLIVEFTRDGEIVKKWPLFDILDPYRIAYDSLATGFWAVVFKEVIDKPGRDWSHGNSIFYDERDDAMLVSFYHQDAVVKLDRKTGDIKWILGPHANWKERWQPYLLSPLDENHKWNYHQHSASYTPQRTVLMFDNGTHGASPYDQKVPADENYSRAVEFEIDEEKGTVRKVWQYGGPEDELFFAPFISGAEWMPETGNVLVADGGRVRGKDGTDAGSPIGGHHWSRIFEVTHDSPAEKVFEIVIDDPEAGWAVYRSNRYPSLYLGNPD